MMVAGKGRFFTAILLLAVLAVSSTSQAATPTSSSPSARQRRQPSMFVTPASLHLSSLKSSSRFRSSSAPLAGATTTATTISSSSPFFLLSKKDRSIRGGGPDPTSAYRALAASIRNFFGTIIRKHFLVTGMFLSILAAAYNPQIGRLGGPLRPEFTVNTIGVCIIFFLTGLNIKVAEFKSAVSNLKLNLAIHGFNLGVWPLLGLAFQPLLINVLKVDPRLATGVLIVSCLPTTINMCIVLTQAAGGSLATAVFNAVLSNALGVFITPALIFAFVGASSISVPYLSVITKLLYKVLTPVAAGLTLRRSVNIRTRVDAPSSKLPLKLVSESILLSIIYTTFCQSFLAGLGISGRDFFGLVVAVPLFHTIALFLMWSLAKALGVPRAQQIAAMYVGSHKTLAFGMPLIKTIFEKNAALALYSAPLLLFHPTQLIIGSLVAPSAARYVEEEGVGEIASQYK